MFKLCINENHSYKHNEQINNQNINNSECFCVKFVKIYPEMPSQYVFEYMVLVDYIGIFVHVTILLAEYCSCKINQYGRSWKLFCSGGGGGGGGGCCATETEEKHYNVMSVLLRFTDSDYPLWYLQSLLWPVFFFTVDVPLG